MDEMTWKNNKSFILTALRCTVAVLMLCLPQVSHAQSGLYVPSAKPVRNMQKALVNPEVFQLLISYAHGSADLADADLDLLDSAYRIAFAVDNPMLYTMTVESYADADKNLARSRADAVCRYFSMRSYANFPIRYARNPIHCSCLGDTAEVLRFEVPLHTELYDINELPAERRHLSQGADLAESVLVTFRNAPDECVGAARGCYLPTKDSTIYGYYAWLMVGRGAVRAVDNTKDTCLNTLDIKVEDHLDYHDFIDHYCLIPHRRQLLAPVGYVVLKAQLPIVPDSCTQPQKDSIWLRIPVTQEQMDAKLKFYAKVATPRGIEFKSLATRKMPGKGTLALQAPINIAQLDTIYIGKRLEEKELDKYFYRVDGPAEAAAFPAAGRYYVAQRVGRNGEPELKKSLRAILRTITEQDDDDPFAGKGLTPKGEEIPE